MQLNHFQSNFISTIFVLKLHSHITVLWYFCRISVISDFSFSGLELETKTWNSRNVFYVCSFFSQAISNGLLCMCFFIFSDG